MIDENGVQTFQSAVQPTSDISALFAKMFICLIVIVILMYVTYWFLRRIIRHRMQKGGHDASIHVVEKRMLSPKTMLYLIKVEGKKVLIAESHLEVKLLDGVQKKRPH